jgi:F-type H+-transporting ATPase subunit delta
VSDETRIARVYAEALYEAAAEGGKVDAVKRDLGEFAKAIDDSTQLRTFFFDEDISGTEKSALLGRLGEGGEPLVTNFLRLLADKDREWALLDAVRIFMQIVERESGVAKVELTVAIPIPDTLRDEIRTSLEQSLGRPVDLKVTVDEDVLGGARLRVGDMIADASVRHRLDQLRALLIKPTANLEVSVEAAP